MQFRSPGSCASGLATSMVLLAARSSGGPTARASAINPFAVQEPERKLLVVPGVCAS